MSLLAPGVAHTAYHRVHVLLACALGKGVSSCGDLFCVSSEAVAVGVPSFITALLEVSCTSCTLVSLSVFCLLSPGNWGSRCCCFSSFLADCCRVSSENSVTKVKPPSSHCPGGHNSFGSAAMTVFSDGGSVSSNLVTGLVVGEPAAQNLCSSRKKGDRKGQHRFQATHVTKHTLGTTTSNHSLLHVSIIRTHQHFEHTARMLVRCLLGKM